MAGGKLSPRQKMINMMYLVLTALLALNVTKEVINAFVTINESVELSKDNLEKKNQTMYAAFAQAMSVDAAKYTDVNKKAQAVKTAADDLNKYIEAVKIDLIRESERLSKEDSTPKLPEMDNKEDYDTPTRLMIGKDDHTGKGAKADTLRQKLEAYKKLIIANAPPNYNTKQLDLLLNTSDPKKAEDGKATWELMSFFHNPVVATVALLSKFESDIRSAESQVNEELLTSVGKFDYKPDKLLPAVIPNSTVVTNGSTYDAKVFLAATSSTIAPEVFIGAKLDATGNCVRCDQALTVDPEGYSHFTQTSAGEGERKWGGVIRVKKGDGSYSTFPFEETYMAQKPSSVVAAEKMNVLYIGVDNPLAISVPGVANDKVKVTIAGAGGTLKSNPAVGGGHYICNVTTVGTTKINVSAEIAGKVIPMGAFDYRVKQVPTPIATVSNKFRTGPIDRNILKAGVVIPVLDDFDFNLFFVTLGFKMVILTSGNLLEYETTGARLTEQMQAAINKAKPGSKVFFENITARMDKSNDTRSRKLSPMSFTIQ